MRNSAMKGRQQGTPGVLGEGNRKGFPVDCGYEIKFGKEWEGSANQGTVVKSCDSFTHQSLLLLVLPVIGWVHTRQLEYFLGGERTHRRVPTPATPEKQRHVQR